MKINTDSTPAWDLALTIRGVDVPTLSPLVAADRSIVNIGERRRGVLVRAWRWLAGEPRHVVADDHETRELRRTVAAFVAPAFRPVLGELSGGELLAVLGSYVGAQQAWYGEVERRARAEAEAAWAKGQMAKAPNGQMEDTIPMAPVGVGGGVGVQRFRVPPTPLVPGAMPNWAKGMFDGEVGRKGD